MLLLEIKRVTSSKFSWFSKNYFYMLSRKKYILKDKLIKQKIQ
jgi:hypothetical protein